MKVPTSGPSTVHLRYREHDLWFCGLPCLARYAAAPDIFTPSADTGLGAPPGATRAG
jgi:hypothetical protein